MILYFTNQGFTKILILFVMATTSIITISLIHPSFSQGNDLLNTTVVSNSKPDIIILNLTNMKVGDSATGLTSITGTIQNNSTENVENMKVNVTLYDSENKTIRDTSRFISGPFTVYEPNSSERFSFLMSVERFDHYGAIAFGERVPK